MSILGVEWGTKITISTKGKEGRGQGLRILTTDKEGRAICRMMRLREM